MKALSSSVTGSYNLGTGRETSLNQLIYRLGMLLDRPIERVAERERGGDIRYSLADNGRLLAAFGGAEFTKLDAGLETYLQSLTTSTRVLS